MLDATGMCGSCRVNIDGQMQLACVDGPEFDGHQVDFDDLMNRLNMFKKEEQIAADGDSPKAKLAQLKQLLHEQKQAQVALEAKINEIEALL